MITNAHSIRQTVYLIPARGASVWLIEDKSGEQFQSHFGALRQLCDLHWRLEKLSKTLIRSATGYRNRPSDYLFEEHRNVIETATHTSPWLEALLKPESFLVINLTSDLDLYPLRSPIDRSNPSLISSFITRPIRSKSVVSCSKPSFERATTTMLNNSNLGNLWAISLHDYNRERIKRPDWPLPLSYKNLYKMNENT